MTRVNVQDRELTETVLAEIALQCPFPYHNRRHTEEVIERVSVLASHAQPRLETEETDLLKLAALFHDYGHSGRTIRQTSLSASRPDLSNEEFAAEEARVRLSKDLTAEQLEVVKNLILATSFGQADAKSVYYRPYQPKTLLEKLLALADIGGFQKPFEEWVEESFRVLQEADPATIPPTFERWLETRYGFLNYCLAKVTEVSEHLDSDYASYLSAKPRALVVTLQKSGELFHERFEKVRRERML